MGDEEEVELALGDEIGEAVAARRAHSDSLQARRRCAASASR